MPFIAMLLFTVDAIKYPYPDYQLGQNSERYHVSRKWRGLRDFYVTNFRELSGIRDVSVTKTLDVVTSMSRKMMIS